MVKSPNPRIYESRSPNRHRSRRRSSIASQLKSRHEVRDQLESAVPRVGGPILISIASALYSADKAEARRLYDPFKYAGARTDGLRIAPTIREIVRLMIEEGWSCHGRPMGGRRGRAQGGH